MGGAVSSGESNDELVDNLKEADYIKTEAVERVFRAMDRGIYYTEPYRSNAYRDLAFKDGKIHMSAPCIYSEVMESLELSAGMSFLNIGSGTGYLSTMIGLLIGPNGVNHGIELHQEVVDYAKDKLGNFFSLSPALDAYDFCPPEFVVGNCLKGISTVNTQCYDRIYVGASTDEESVPIFTDLLKVGGLCVIPINDSLIQITRVSETEMKRKTLLPVSFAGLIPPKAGNDNNPVILPQWKPPSLHELCRFRIRGLIRSSFADILALEDEAIPKGTITKKRQRKTINQRISRRANRLLVVQRRRTGGEQLDGLVAVAYSRERNETEISSGSEENDALDRINAEHVTESSSDEDQGEEERPPRPIRHSPRPARRLRAKARVMTRGDERPPMVARISATPELLGRLRDMYRTRNLQAGRNDFEIPRLDAVNLEDPGEASSSTISTDSSDAEGGLITTSAESGIVPDFEMEGDEEEEEPEKVEREPRIKKTLKTSRICIEMRERISALPLPPGAKAYLNYYRKVEQDEDVDERFERNDDGGDKMNIQ